LWEKDKTGRLTSNLLSTRSHTLWKMFKTLRRANPAQSLLMVTVIMTRLVSLHDNLISTMSHTVRKMNNWGS
jgi:hypothetical protein